MAHSEGHKADTGWLRAAVLGANDGLISTSSLVVGVAAAEPSHHAILLAGIAGWVAGALSMAAGEYVSVSSQADTENADLARERQELTSSPSTELDELTNIYVSRGLSPQLASQVAVQLTARDALGAHARDELNIVEATRARPMQAAWTSAAAFSLGAALPLALTTLLPSLWLSVGIGAGTLISLFVLGAVAARLGGAPPLPGALRVGFWGAAAMVATALVGKLFGAVV